ncbi:6-bladed beta-propeller [Parabacteroides distasonis]|uniref:6-bladed beta-propeller n=2 Tax=Parabacteroides distasonis TaxID=823 RepID=A0A5C6K9R3_PARDI|nr:6-bladed beta-propeller [Parabacteroides distasonis]
MRIRMEKCITCFVVVLVFMIFVGCDHSKGKNINEHEELPTFDLEAEMERPVPNTFIWNDLVANTKFVPLSSDNNMLLSGSIDIRFIDDYCIVVVDNMEGAFYRYSTDGKVQHRFKFLGNGPGEYANLAYLYVDPNHAFMDVYDEGNEKRIRYDWEGNFLEEKSLGGLVVPCFVSDDYAILRGKPETEWQYCVTDNSLDVQHNYVRLGEEYDVLKRSAVQILTSVCMNEDRFICSRPMSDTVYQITTEEMRPLFLLKKGKYDIHYEDLGRFMTQEIKTMDCIKWMKLSYIPGYYLIDYQQDDRSHSEIWNEKTHTVVAHMVGKDGLPFRLPSGKDIVLRSGELFINGNLVAVPIPSYELEGELDGITADDNQVLLIMRLRSDLKNHLIR